MSTGFPMVDAITRVRNLVDRALFIRVFAIILFGVEAYLYMLSAWTHFSFPQISLSGEFAGFLLRLTAILAYVLGVSSRRWRPAKYYGLVFITISMIASFRLIPSTTLLELLAVMLVRDSFFPLYLNELGNIIRRGRLELNQKTVIVAGRKTLVGITLVVLGYVIFIQLVGYIVSNASNVVSSAVNVLEEPLASFWNAFLETRIGHVVSLITVVALLLVALDMILSTIVYALTVTKASALEEAQSEIKKWFVELRDWKTWHQRMMVENGSILIGLLLYPVFYIVLTAVLDVFKIGLLDDVRYLPTIISIGFYVLAWGLMRRYLRSILAIGKGSLKPPTFTTTAVTAGLAIVLAIYIYMFSPSTLSLLTNANSQASDPLSIYWDDQYAYNRITEVVESLDIIGRLLIKLFWG